MLSEQCLLHSVGDQSSQLRLDFFPGEGVEVFDRVLVQDARVGNLDVFSTLLVNGRLGGCGVGSPLTVLGELWIEDGFCLSQLVKP